MSQMLHLEVPDALFKAIETQAAVEKTDAASIATAALQQHFQVPVEPRDKGGDGESLEAMFGAIDLGHPTGLDNEAIDADLIKDYSRGLTN